MNKENIEAIVPLLPTQQFILAASLKLGHSTYVQQLVFEVENYNHEQIKEAIDKLYQSYDCLRSIVLYKGLKQPVWAILKKVRPHFQCHFNEVDWNLLAKKRIEGFILEKEPPIQIDWLEVQSKRYLIITYHHILWDGWGRQKILKDFLNYLKFPQAPVYLKSYTIWYETWKKLDHASAYHAYKKYLTNFKEYAKLSFLGSGQSQNLTYKTLQSQSLITQLSKQLELTSAEFILFAWACFIAKWTNQNHVQFGVVKQNGLIENCPNGFGLGIQTLPFQCTIDPHQKIYSLLNLFKYRERLIAPYAYVDITQDIFQNLSYDFIIAFENYPIENTLLEFQNDFQLIKNHDFSEFPLSLSITPNGDHFVFQWDYNLKFYTSNQIECIANHFMDAFEILFHHIEKSFHEIEFWQNPPLPEMNCSLTPHDFFYTLENQIQKKEKKWLLDILKTYFIEHAINRIWIFGDKYENLDILISAALITQVEFLTINENETLDFIQNLEKQYPADIIFSSTIYHPFDNAVLLENLTSLPSSIFKKTDKKTDAAFAICTSGSTGTPKIVLLSLENLLAFLDAWNQKIPWRDQEVFAVIAHPAFDIGIAELIFPLWKGWETQIIYKNNLSNHKELAHLMEKVTAFHMVPALLQNWIEDSSPDEKERIIMTGGDRVPSILQYQLHKKFPNARLFQFYGPSECSILVSGFENIGQYEKHLLPLGSQFHHAMLFIFDKQGNLAPPFQEGEIVVCGNAVGLGYANNTHSEKFFSYQMHNAYKTGDIGFRDNNNHFFFISRIDQQIKINGQRIEISRIENALAEWSSLQNWVVIIDENLIYAFAKADQDFPLPHIEKLQYWLPFYAIPNKIKLVTEFPLNKNGKIDRKKLIETTKSETQNLESLVLDPKIEKIIKEIFPNKTLYTHRSWYANGLNSIDAMKFSSFLIEKLSISIPIQSILSLSQLSQLNLWVNQKKTPPQETFIQNQKKVYSTAARILFLSESDEFIAKSYWITTGIQLNKDIDYQKIIDWIKKQKTLHWSIETFEKQYLWKSTFPHHYELHVENESQFLEYVQNQFLPIQEALFMSFLGIGRDKNFLAFKVHHAFLDGLGVEHLWKKLYEDFTNHTFTELQFLIPNEEKMDKAFWNDYLKTIEIKSLPFQRLNSCSKASKRLNFVLTETQKKELLKIRSEYQCSLFEAGLIVFCRMWYSYFPNAEFSIGIPVNIGSYANTHAIPAMSVNILPLKIDSDQPEFILKNWRNLFSKKNTPFAEIAQLDKNQKNGFPFFNCTYLYHSQKEHALEFEYLNFKRLYVDYPLSLDFIENHNQWIFSWEYSQDLFSDTAITKIHEKLFSYYENPSNIFINYALAHSSLKSIWEGIVEKFAFKVALIIENEQYTYQELDTFIKKEALNNLNPLKTIAVLVLERNLESIVKILYHLIYEIPFIPVDSETTQERISYIKNLAKSIELHDTLNTPLQYVIATSGTTGKPKLVGVTKKGYLSAIQAWKKDYHLKPSDVCMLAASFSFDVSLGDIGRAFFHGASLLLLNNQERKDPMLLLHKINHYSVTVFETTPFIVRWWKNENIQLQDYPSLRLLIVGSDSWKMGELRSFFKTKNTNQKIINSYGLSETTIDNSFFDPDIDDHPNYSDDMLVPIGKPMSHCIIKVVDKYYKEVPNGLIGTLTIQGEAVGLGYWNNNHWTNLNSSIWYTADKGFLDEWGILHFIGRTDRQVKIRGQRIELLAIESILSSFYPQTEWYVIDFQHDLSSELAAFYNKNLSELEIKKLKHHILENYPSYYLPAIFIHQNKIPVNANQKVDYQQLKNIALEKFNKKDFSIENGDLLNRILEHYFQCFNEEITPEQNFFQNGKNSFEAIYFVRKWNQNHKEKMSVQQIFMAENLRILSQSIALVEPSVSPRETPQKWISKPQESIWFEIQKGNSSLYNLPHFIEIPPHYDIKKFQAAFEKTLQSCKALWVKFQENEKGEVEEIPISHEGFHLNILKIHNLSNFIEKAFLKEINLLEGPAFEAMILDNHSSYILYFNPHHIVYDGGSDEFLLKTFHSFFDNNFSNDEIIHLNSLPFTNDCKINWSKYFEILPQPNVIFHQPDTSIQPVLVVSCPNNFKEYLQQTCNEYQTTQAVIISYLLTQSLHENDIPVHWISLAIDHRTSESIGMYMRSYPFPGYFPTYETDQNIAIQKWAFHQLLGAYNQNIIYPINTTYEEYHQIGLIIQHPFHLETYQKFEERIEYSRPRLPLTLYVENINQEWIFRWEFDHHQISMDKVRSIHQKILVLLEELAIKRKKIIHFKPSHSNTDLKKTVRTQDYSIELMNIWKKYTHNGNIENLHFFESGGNSIKALLMLKDIENHFQTKISMANFFKQPTLSYLQDCLFTKPSEQLVEQIKNSYLDKEIWLLPPIMGLGIIFNTWDLPDLYKVFTFNYPSAIGIPDYDSIQEIAELLLNERIKMSSLPSELTLVGYSMGAIVAFEMIKILEKNSVNIKKLIVLDKIPQTEFAKPSSKNISLSTDLMYLAKQIAIDESDYNKILNYLILHQNMIENYHQKGCIQCKIDVYYCEGEYVYSDYEKWKLLSPNEVSFIKIENTTHYEIPKNWEPLKNSFLIIMNKLTPFQLLFFNREIHYGNSASNILKGKAVITGADFELFYQAVFYVLKNSEWAYLSIDVLNNTWKKNDTWQGSLEKYCFQPNISFNHHLWSVQLIQETPNQVIMYVFFHHCLADAHSFNLFWNQIFRYYQQKNLEPISLCFDDENSYRSFQQPIQKQLPSDLGLGPIQRISIHLNERIKNHLTNWASQKGSNIMLLLLEYIQNQLKYSENDLEIPLKIGIALRNRMNIKQKNNFFTHVNFLPLSEDESLSLYEKIMQLFRNQNYPLIHYLNEHSSTIAFNVLFSYQKESYLTSENLKVQFFFQPPFCDDNIVSFHLLEYDDNRLTIHLDFRLDFASEYYWKNFIRKVTRQIISDILSIKEKKDLQKFAILEPNYKKSEDFGFWYYFDNADENRTALICNNQKWTFGELRNIIQNIDIALTSKFLYLEPQRNAENIIQLLAAWKKGIPITYHSIKPIDFYSDSVAYIAKTSGTTHQKTVLISFEALSSLITDWKKLYKTQNSVHLSITHQLFDVFLGDLLRSILSGETLVLATETERLDALAINHLISEHQVTHLETTPSFLLYLLPNLLNINSLKCIVCGSEPIPFNLWSEIQKEKWKSIKFYNSYGLTECSIDSAASELNKHPFLGFPSGFPLGNQIISIRTQNLEYKPLGVWGEICIEGICVGKNIEENTSPNIFRTGDKGMILPKEGLIVNGRMNEDFLKVNGRRIPKTMIEQFVASIPSVKACMVLAIQNSVVLFLYGNVPLDIIQEKLKSYLSRYQLPDDYYVCEDWPINQNGKVDRKKLIEWFQEKKLENSNAWKPQNIDYEIIIHNTLIARNKPFGQAHDSFIAFGWNSIELLSLANELNLKGMLIPINAFIQNPTIQFLLNSVHSNTKNEKSNSSFTEVDYNIDDILSVLNEQ